MEKYMNDIIKKVDELINLIKESKEYREYLNLKEILRKDEDITSLIEEIKKSQRNIVRLKQNGKSFEKEEETINKNLDLLNNFPIYVEFSYLQKELNDEFQIIKDLLESEINKITN